MFSCFSYLEKSNYDLCQAAAVGDVKLLGGSCRVEFLQMFIMVGTVKHLFTMLY